MPADSAPADVWSKVARHIKIEPFGPGNEWGRFAPLRTELRAASNAGDPLELGIFR